MDLNKLTATWYMKMFRLLVRHHTDAQQIFENVSFINFNYDRCLEYFSLNALMPALDYLRKTPSILPRLLAFSTLMESPEPCPFSRNWEHRRLRSVPSRLLICCPSLSRYAPTPNGGGSAHRRGNSPRDRVCSDDRLSRVRLLRSEHGAHYADRARVGWKYLWNCDRLFRR
jgi:hypothetical protein